MSGEVGSRLEASGGDGGGGEGRVSGWLIDQSGYEGSV